MGKVRNVAVVGAGITKFGRREASWKDMVQEAGKSVMKDVPKLDKSEIDSLFVGACMPERWAYQGQPAAVAAELLGLCPTRVIARTEQACASGQAAIRYAWLSIAAGVSDIAMVVGAEKMCLEDMNESNMTMMSVGDREFESAIGFTAPGFFGMVMARHTHLYGTTKDQYAAVSIKNHGFSVTNPYAQFTKPLTREAYDNSAMISAPVCLFDCSGMTDGAAAIILASEERAKELTDSPMWILGGAQCVLAANTMNQMGELTDWRALKRAGEEAYKMAGITAKDVDVAEVHDCFTVSEIIEYEELGFCKKGEGGRFIQEGRSGLDGDVAVNTSGGLLSCGHPLGATSVRQAWEVFNQLRGTVPKERQRKNCEIGLTHNLSGMAQVHSIMIYGKSPKRG